MKHIKLFEYFEILDPTDIDINEYEMLLDLFTNCVDTYNLQKVDDNIFKGGSYWCYKYDINSGPNFKKFVGDQYRIWHRKTSEWKYGKQRDINKFNITIIKECDDIGNETVYSDVARSLLPSKFLDGVELYIKRVQSLGYSVSEMTTYRKCRDFSAIEYEINMDKIMNYNEKEEKEEELRSFLKINGFDYDSYFTTKTI